jgi:hypothetical protein
LRLARLGTYSWTAAEVEEHLRDVGFKQAETFSLNPTTVIVVGRKGGTAVSHDS